MEKRAVMSDFIIWILIALLILAVLFVFYFISNGKLVNLSDSIKSLFSFGK
jgi:hypothetical protein